MVATTVRKTISLPPYLGRDTEETARPEGRMLSAVVRQALRQARSVRLHEEIGAMRDYWSRQAKERAVLSEGGGFGLFISNPYRLGGAAPEYTMAGSRRPISDLGMKWTSGKPGESSASRHTFEEISRRTFNRPPPFNCSYLPS